MHVKTYLKILVMAFLVQFLSFIIMYFLDYIFGVLSNNSTIIPLIIGMGGLMTSTIIGVILPIRYEKSLVNKILTIILLPTNYTLILCFFGMLKLAKSIRQIIIDLSKYFG